jgi:streptomycin 6-kinase
VSAAVDDAGLVEAVTARLSLRFGPAVAAWCAALPGLAAEMAARWGLVLGEAYPDGASSVALRCVLPDGAPAALKLSPDPPFLADQAEMLLLLKPSGRVPAVFAADAAAGAVLMERIEPGTCADELALVPSPREWGELVTGLHCTAPPPGYPRDLRGRCDESFARIGARQAEPRISPHVFPAALDRGADRYRHLLATAQTQVLLHGDLHLGNVLDGGAQRGLVAIDPKACVGDPCFDAMDYAMDGAGSDGVAARCDSLAPAAGLDPDRLFAWCRAFAPIVAINRIEQPGKEQSVKELLMLAR